METSISADNNVKEKDISFFRGLAIFVTGFILGLTKLSGIPAPFAAAGICAMNGLECLFMAVGSAAGFVISGGVERCITYITAMSVIGLIRFLISSFTHGRRSEILSIIQSAAAGICVFAANIFSAHSVNEIFLSSAFSVLSAIFAYCIEKLRYTGIKSAFSSGKISFRVMECIIFVLLTAALTSLNAGVVNIGIFISVLSVLYSSGISSEASPAVCAVLSFAGVASGNQDFAAACIMLSVSSPVIMLIGNRGRITKACTFILITGTGLIAAGINENNGIAVISAVAAAAVYMTVPERLSPFTYILRNTELAASAAPYSAFGKKLRFMSDTIDEMREAVIKTSKALENENIRDISWVYLKASEQICKYCPSNMKCWGQLYNETADIMNKAVGNLKSGIFVREDMLCGHIRSSCPEISRLTSELNRQYAIYCSAESASRKITEMRSVLTGQLSATGTMLRKMSDEIGQNDTYDEPSAINTEKVLKEYGIKDCSVIAVIINNRLCIDAYGRGELNISTEELSDRLSAALDRELDMPVITDTADRKHITVSERARYDVQIKVFRKNKSGERHSGDTSDCFCDGRGNVYMILSDGMGSGTRARIDSAFSCGMLSKLLKAGIDLDASLEMLNSSLLVKSSDESFATLDLCRIDLCTGNVMMCRAGGSSIYIRCGDNFTKIGEEGMPLGISLNADYKGRTFRISDGDMIIMTSDGAEIDDKWLEKVVMRDRKTDISDIIDTVGAALRFSSGKENEDDITVIGVRLIR